MSNIEPQVVTEGVNNRLQNYPEVIEQGPTRVGRGVKDKARDREYSKDLQSRFGSAFLPYAYQLESVEKERTTRKRKGTNKKKKLVRITSIKEYKKQSTRKLIQYEKQLQTNKKKAQKK